MGPELGRVEPGPGLPGLGRVSRPVRGDVPDGLLPGPVRPIVVGLAYALATAGRCSIILLLAGDWWQYGCNPECIRNVLVFWPDAELHETTSKSSRRRLVSSSSRSSWWPCGGTGARPPPRRAGRCCHSSSGRPWPRVWIVEALSDAFGLAPGIAFFDSPSGGAIGLIAPFILPVGLLLAIVRTRLSRGRVANLVVEIGRGVPVGGLRDVLARALDDPSLQLAFAAPTGVGFVDASGQPLELPVGDPTRTVTRLERDDELLGVLVHDPAIDDEDPGLVEAVGNAARLALENERLAAEVRAQLDEVRASRVRIVEAADAERRRVERDLHDGAQQRLVALALRLQVAEDDTAAAALLEEATSELQIAIGEVRGLARGVHPTILTEAGLRAAVDALAERTLLPVAVDIPERRFDTQVEATAYFVVAEALTNVARYAEASEARVAAVEEDGRLVMTVADDGRGGADPTVGSGLRGLTDRLAAVDGRLTISSRLAAARRPGRNTAPPRQTADSGPGHATAGTFRGLARVPVAGGAAVPTPAWARSHFRARRSCCVHGRRDAAVAWAAAYPRSGAPRLRASRDFVRPFDYLVPAGADVRLYPEFGTLHVLSPPPRNMNGLSIWAVDEVFGGPLPEVGEPPGAVGPRQPGVGGLLDYLRSVDGLDVEPGRFSSTAARQFSVDLTLEEDWQCPGEAGASYGGTRRLLARALTCRLWGRSDTARDPRGRRTDDRDRDLEWRVRRRAGVQTAIRSSTRFASSIGRRAGPSGEPDTYALSARRSSRSGSSSPTMLSSCARPSPPPSHPPASRSSARPPTCPACWHSSSASDPTSPSSTSGCHRPTRRRASRPRVASGRASDDRDPRPLAVRRDPLRGRLIRDDPAGVGYLLKQRVMKLDDLSDAVRRVARADSVIDPEVVARLLGRRRRHSPWTS